MTWTNLTKNPSRPIRVEKSSVTRGSFPSTAQTRGDIEKDIRGTAGEAVSRKEMEDIYGKKVENNFSEINKYISDWSEV